VTHVTEISALVGAIKNAGKTHNAPIPLGGKTMMKSYIPSALAGALLLGLATAALAATGEFNNMCSEGLSLGRT
jgi:hypothetical protein